MQKGFLNPRTLCLTLPLLLAASCSDSSKPNSPPVVVLTQAPADSATVTGPLTLAWSGSDPDGSIKHYTFRLDEDAATETQDTTTTLQFTKEDGSDTDPQLHTFRVSAVDNADQSGAPDSVVFWVAILNSAPEVWITSRPPAPPEYAGSEVSFTWDASDADGQVVSYEYKFGTDPWQVTTAKQATIDFSTGSPVYSGGVVGLAHEPRIHEFSLRAQDEEGKYSPAVTATVLTGPENVAPEVTLVTAPPSPNDKPVTQAEVSWSWSASDPDGSVLRMEYAVDLDAEDDWVETKDTSVTLEFKPDDGYFNDPKIHSFHLRVMDDDSTWSAVESREFELALANTPPVVRFINPPDPENVQAYRSPYEWEGEDDAGLDHFEYAVDDTSSWISTTAVLVDIKFSAPNVDTTKCIALGACQSFGDHVVYLRGVDEYGLVSPVIASPISTFTLSPYTTIQSPESEDGEVVDAPAALDLEWTARDLDGLEAPVLMEMAILEVEDFESHPTPEALRSAEWDDLGEVLSTSVELEQGQHYLIGLRGTDEAGATESHLIYGKNVIKILVAGP